VSDVGDTLQMMCEDADLREMGLPLGPRKKLLSHLHQLNQIQVCLFSDARIPVLL